MIIGIPTLVPPFLLFQNASRFDKIDHSWCQQWVQLAHDRYCLYHLLRIEFIAIYWKSYLLPFVENRIYCHLLKIEFLTIKHNDPLPLYEYFYFCFYRLYHVRHSIRWLIRNTTTSLLLPHLVWSQSSQGDDQKVILCAIYSTSSSFLLTSNKSDSSFSETRDKVWFFVWFSS